LISITPLAQMSAAAVESLLDQAFGPDRHGRTAYRLRAGTEAIDDLSLAAVEQDALVGSIQCWPIELVQANGRTTPLILVGPVAVSPERQRDGIGRMLMEAMLARADSYHAETLVLIGDPEYYERFFGFSADRTGGWQVPGPVERRRLLARVKAGPGLPIDAEMRPRIVPALVAHDQ
jgi:predicted N-acetyltransferase YhbS